MSELSLNGKTLLADFTPLAIGGSFLLVFALGVTPLRRGFSCTDESIMYPFHKSTIPTWSLYIYCIAAPIIIIGVTEFVLHRKSRKGAFFLSKSGSPWILHFYKSIVEFLFGCASSQLATDIGKYSMGRLRPNFISVCAPNITLSTACTYDKPFIEEWEYVCTKADDDAKEFRLSFPSGHASFSAFAMLYLSIYIQVKWTIESDSGRATSTKGIPRIVKGAVQLFLFLVAYYTSLSRVKDNMHHWSDVLAGALLGSVVASLTVKYVSSLIQTTEGRRTSKLGDFDMEAQPITNSIPPPPNSRIDSSHL